MEHKKKIFLIYASRIFNLATIAVLVSLFGDWSSAWAWLAIAVILLSPNIMDYFNKTLAFHDELSENIEQMAAQKSINWSINGLLWVGAVLLIVSEFILHDFLSIISITFAIAGFGLGWFKAAGFDFEYKVNGGLDVGNDRWDLYAALWGFISSLVFFWGTEELLELGEIQWTLAAAVIYALAPFIFKLYNRKYDYPFDERLDQLDRKSSRFTYTYARLALYGVGILFIIIGMVLGFDPEVLSTGTAILLIIPVISIINSFALDNIMKDIIGDDEE